MTPKLSIIIPVLREQSVVNALIRDIALKCPASQCQIVIVDGSPDSSTLKAVTVPHENLIKISSLKGRASQMNAGANAAKGEILLFLHADSVLPETALSDIYNAYREKATAAGAFSLKLDSDNVFLKFISFTATMRSKILEQPFGDQGLFIKREYFSSIGGFKDIPLMEDTEIIQRIKKRGGRIKTLDSYVVSSARKWKEKGILFNTLKNHLIRFLYSVGVSPETLHRMYYAG